MKTLFLLRHAKSSWKDESLPDFERPLTRRGRRAAETIGHYLRSHEILPELVLSSPALRARETLDRMIKAARLSTEVRFDQRIYGATAMRLAEVVADIENDRKVALIVGHNPGIEELLLFFTGQAEQVPTGGLAKVVTKTTKWAAVGDKRASLEWLVRPKELGKD
jgi:phosphohistidine phosphatase